jgi:rhodanese-related sulfurtransferase
MDLGKIGILAAIYPATWGFGQLFTGAWSDHVGRKWLIVWGMWTQAIGIGLVAASGSFHGFAAGAALLGIGTAMVYPTLLAAIGDVALPSWRASSVGVYRLWRDLGYAVGALLAGVAADALGLPAAIWMVAALTFASGVVVATRMTETLRRRATPVRLASTCVEPVDLPRIANVIVIDVRSPQEFAEGHVDGAINVPLDEISQSASTLPKNTAVVTVCGKGGGRSEQAAHTLRALGFKSARPLCGGTQAWMQLAARGTR